MALTASEEALVRQLLDQQAAILSLAGNEATITSKLGATKVTLADLVAASGVADADLLLIRQGTTDKSVTPLLLKGYVQDGIASQKGVQAGDYNTSVAAGTADAITGDYTPNILALEDGLTLFVRATAANATTTPTFAPDGLAAKTIVKGAGTALQAGDIAGAGHWLALVFNATLDKWVLLNPFTWPSSSILGTNTNNSAAAGYVGEFVSSTLTSGTPVSLTNLTIANVTSITLTAGDWDVDGQVSYAFGATTSVTRLRQGASSASATMTNGLDMSVQTTAAQVPTNAIDANLPIPKTRFSLNATTTIYLVAQAEFTVSTCAAYGTIRARRVR